MRSRLSSWSTRSRICASSIVMRSFFVSKPSCSLMIRLNASAPIIACSRSDPFVFMPLPLFYLIDARPLEDVMRVRFDHAVDLADIAGMADLDNLLELQAVFD